VIPISHSSFSVTTFFAWKEFCCLSSSCFLLTAEKSALTIHPRLAVNINSPVHRLTKAYCCNLFPTTTVSRINERNRSSKQRRNLNTRIYNIVSYAWTELKRGWAKAFEMHDITSHIQLDKNFRKKVSQSVSQRFNERKKRKANVFETYWKCIRIKKCNSLRTHKMLNETLTIKNRQQIFEPCRMIFFPLVQAFISVWLGSKFETTSWEALLTLWRRKPKFAKGKMSTKICKNHQAQRSE
jgi:hypothetical protein